MKTNATKLMMVIAAAAFTACSSNTDLYDEGFIENNQKASYAENFVKKFPNVSLNQNWDYSTKNFSYTLGDNNNITYNARTRAGEGSWSKEANWYEVDNNTVNWMHEQLTEGDDHTNLGSPFYMTVPGNDFWIVPIYQGVASAVWDLHVVIGDQDYQIWGKSEEIQIKDQCPKDWHSVVHPTYWDDANTNEGWWESLFNTDGNDKNYSGKPNTVTNVRAIPRKFSGFPVGENMHFYLKVRTGDPGRCNEGDVESSLNGQMLALNCPRPANIPDDYEAMIIGCEDAHLELSDWDFNDVVFLVYGKQVPKPIKIEKGDPEVNENRIVRYMIEDLGDTEDFDFNDIVIDMVESTPKYPIYTNGVFTGWEYGTTTQKAVIRHLGGTLPFILTVGNTTLPELGGQETFQTDPNLAFDVTGWDINRHNIGVQVRQNISAGAYNNVRFPLTGEAPMIIAKDPNVMWNAERVPVTEAFFNVE